MFRYSPQLLQDIVILFLVLYTIYVYFLLKVNRLFYWNKKIVFLLDFFCDLKYLIDIISRKYFDRIVASFKKYLLL